MVDITPYQSLAELSSDKEDKRPNLVVAGASFISAVLFAAYGAMTALYVGERADVLAEGERWLPSGVDIPLTQPNYMGVSMFLAFVASWWAVSSVKNSDRSNAIIAHVLAMLFSLGFIVQSFYLFSLLELEVGESLVAVLIVALAGTHMVLMIIGMVALALNLFRTAVGDFAGVRYEAVKAVAIYWTCIASIYAVLWYTVYITK